NGLPGGGEVVARGAEGQVVQTLLRPAVEHHAGTLQRRRTQRDRAVTAALVHETEARVELLADRLVGDLERVVEQRAHGHIGYLLGWRSLHRSATSTNGHGVRLCRLACQLLGTLAPRVSPILDSFARPTRAGTRTHRGYEVLNT